MIDRYSTPEMAALWTEETKMSTWLEVEIAVCEAWVELGEMPADAVAEIKAKAAFDPARVREIEETTQHDVIAFLTNVAEYVAVSYTHLTLPTNREV